MTAFEIPPIEVLFACALVAPFILYALYLFKHRGVPPAEEEEDEPPGRSLALGKPGTRIRDITVDDVRAGKLWRVVDDRLGLDQLRLEDLQVVPAQNFDATDHVVYSALLVADSGSVRPLLLIKEVGDYDYGGDYCELHEGAWRQVGLVPNPTAAFEQEYVAQPLDLDPSFGSSDHDHRDFHRSGFSRHASGL